MASGIQFTNNVFNTDGSHPGRGWAMSDSGDRRKNYIWVRKDMELVHGKAVAVPGYTDIGEDRRISSERESKDVSE